MDSDRSAVLDAIDLMEPEAFEEWVLSEVASVGYRVSRTPRTGDGGADGIALAPTGSGRPNLILQCKHSQTGRKTGIAAVREVLAARKRYRLQPPLRLVVVTNAPGFTADAMSFAEEHKVLLVARHTLADMAGVLRGEDHR